MDASKTLKDLKFHKAFLENLNSKNEIFFKKNKSSILKANKYLKSTTSFSSSEKKALNQSHFIQHQNKNRFFNKGQERIQLS